MRRQKAHLVSLLFLCVAYINKSIYIYELAVEFCIFEISKSPLQDVQKVNDLKRRDYLKAFCFYLVEHLQLFLHNRFLHRLVTEVNDYSLIK